MCTEDSPSGLWRTLGKRVGCKPSGVRIPHPPPLAPEPIEVPGFLLLVAPPGPRPPRVLPAREPSAPRASLGASSRSPARPRRPRGGLQSGGACCSDLGSGLRPPAGAVVWPCVPKPALALRTLRRPSHRRRLSCCVHWPRPGLVPRETRVKRRGRAERTPGLDPTCLDPEALDDLRARERRKDLARHEELRTTQTRADAAPARRARRIDEEPP